MALDKPPFEPPHCTGFPPESKQKEPTQCSVASNKKKPPLYPLLWVFIGARPLARGHTETHLLAIKNQKRSVENK